MKIDWEKRRYEIAKDAMAAFISAPCYQFCVNNNYYEASITGPRYAAEDAVKYADALIDELKKPKRAETGKKSIRIDLLLTK